MIDYMTEYEKYIKGKLTNGKLSTEDRNDFIEHIKFMQHERLIHLLVTMLFASLLMFGFVMIYISFNWMTFILTVIIFIVEIFYIFHYYKLENGVQKMYRLYDEVTRMNSN